MTVPTPRPAARPGAGAQQLDQADALVEALYRALFLAPPKRAALMNGPGAERKYSDPPRGHNFTPDDLRWHLAGRRTWATTLADGAGLALAGCRDYDAGGESAVLAALEAAHGAGLVAFGIVLAGGDHPGGHLWAFYRNAAPACDIRAQLGALPGGKGEVYPSGNCIRLPFGLHRRKNTRGVLVLQDGRRFNLDNPAERLAGLHVVLAMRRNAAPPAAPIEARSSSGGAFGAHNPVDWLNLPSGAALMGSPRYQALFKWRPQLAKLARSERVVLWHDGIPDDSDSAQVAVLVCNLLTTCGRGQKPGHGAPPLAEIRAVALHWKPALRDGRKIEHYMAHVDSEIDKYMPPDYAPIATGAQLGALASTPAQLAAPRHRGRPSGQRGSNAAQLMALLESLPADADGWRSTTRAQLGQALQLSAEMVSKLLSDLRTSGAIEQRQRQRGCAFRVVIKSAPVDFQGCNRACDDRATTPESAPPACMESHSPPPGPSAPASGPAPAPAIALDNTPASGTAPAGVCLPPAPARPMTLAELVAEGFDAIGGRHTKKRVKQIKQYVALNAPIGAAWPAGALDRMIADEQRRRIWARQLAATEAKARALPLKRLRRASEAAAGRAADLARRGLDNQAWVWRQIGGVYAAEESRRALPDEDCWIDLEIYHAQQRRAAAAPAPAPIEAPAPAARQLTIEDAPPAPAPAWRGLVARLKALNAKEAEHGTK